MNRILLKLFLLLFLVGTVGCGDGAAKPAVDEDELSQWVSDNPAPEEVPLDEEN